MILPLFVLVAATTTFGQANDHKLFGDLHVDESKVEGAVPLSYDILLYTRLGNVLQRVSIPNRGRFQFLGLKDGEYDVAVEIENHEVARVRVSIYSPFKTDFRQDIELRWLGNSSGKAGAVFADDFYQRLPANEKLFRDGERAKAQKQLTAAVMAFNKLLLNDPRDFQAWSDLADVHFVQRQYLDAENEYLHAIDARPGFFLALLNLGRLEITLQKYDVAVEALTRAVKVRADSADANYFLGESYLRLKKGSLAVSYLNEALRLDPEGMAEVHLRLATLYQAAGLPRRAAAEYEAFLKKRPDYRDRRKLEKYIAENHQR
ncbi:MAG TPA: tetratricopeptide repeat protein [Pyrinomonadaceae bacterium]|nr:tetratricopeptide repeat protein [Pyrinomonadaceae bacterium]